jgi:hypothetical protein
MGKAAVFERDFDLILDVLEGFLKQPRVQRALTNIWEMEVTG